MYFAFFSSKFQQKSFWIIESSFCFKTLSMSPVQVFFVPRQQWRGITTAKGSHSIILAFFARLFSGKRRQWLSKPGNRSLQWSENAILMDDFQHSIGSYEKETQILIGNHTTFCPVRVDWRQKVVTIYKNVLYQDKSFVIDFGRYSTTLSKQLFPEQ